MSKKLLALVESDVLSLITTDAVLKKKIKAVFTAHARALDGPQIVLKRVVSSNVEAVGYDAADKTLRVKFVTGSTYDYMKVPASVHSAMLKAASAGKFLNDEIKPNYGAIKIS